MENLRRAGYAQVVGVEPNPVAAEIARKKGYDVYTSYLTEEQATTDRRRARACSTRCSCAMSSSMSATSTASSRASGRCCATTDCWCSNCPRSRKASRSAALPSCGKSIVNYFTPALAEHLLRRFGFQVCDRRNYVFGGGSMAFVARKRAVPVACALSRSRSGADDRPAAAVRRRHRAPEDRAQEPRLARPLGRFPGSGLWRRAALLPARVGLPRSPT